MSYLRRFAPSHPDPWAVTPGDVAAWLAAHDWGPNTRRSALGALRAFYKHGVAGGRTQTNPAGLLDAVQVPRALPRPASEVALTAALAGADQRLRLMLMLGAFAGLRRSEIASVRPSRDLVGEDLRVLGKGGHERMVPVHPLLGALIRTEVDRRRAGEVGSGFGAVEADPDGWLFPSPYGGHLTPGCVGVLLSRALPPGVTGHMLRHRFATQALAVERDLRAVQELLGHARPETTQVYAAVAPGAMRSAVRGLLRTSGVLTADAGAHGDALATVTPIATRMMTRGCPTWCVEHEDDDGDQWHRRTLARFAGVDVTLELLTGPGYTDTQVELVMRDDATSTGSPTVDGVSVLRATPELLLGLAGLAGFADLLV